MEKKLYMSPLTEVAEIGIHGALMSSPVDPVTPVITPMPDPSHPGAPKHRTPVF